MSNQKKKGMNLPNKLTVLRVCLVPVFIVVMMLPASVLHPIISGLIGVAIFIAASFTDMLDGKIARKYGLVTDFGKLMDPLADKFMVIGALAVIVYRANTNALRLVFTLVLLGGIFRELAVTSLRLVASTSAGAVVAANMLGKIKTNTQIVCVSVLLLEPIVLPFCRGWLSLLSVIVMAVFTLWSGLNYILSYWKYLDTEK